MNTAIDQVRKFDIYAVAKADDIGTLLGDYATALEYTRNDGKLSTKSLGLSAGKYLMTVQDRFGGPLRSIAMPVTEQTTLLDIMRTYSIERYQMALSAGELEEGDVYDTDEVFANVEIDITLRAIHIGLDT